MRNKILLVLFVFVLFAGFSSATVTSADSITYNSNNDFFSGEVFAISVASDGSTDKIDIFLPSSELDSQAEGEVTQDLEIDFSDQNTELRYPTATNGELRKVRTFQPHHEKGYDTEDAAKDAAESICAELVDTDGQHSTYGIDYDLSTFSWEFYCFTEDTYLGTPAYIDNPEEIFSTDVSLRASGKEPLTKTLSNGDAGTGVVTDLGRHAKIRWNGNLDTGASEPNIGRVYGLHANRYSGSWRVISQARYDDYVNVVEQEGLSQITNWMEGDISKWDAVSTLNDEAWEAAEVDTSSDLAYTDVADSSLNDGTLTYDTEDLLSYPMFTVYVDAGENGYIEVSKPTGNPSIVSTSSVDVNEIGGGTVDVSVRNIGEGEGSFSARLTDCSNGFTFSDTQETKVVQPGESVSYSFDVSFQSTSSESREVSGSCRVEVEDTGSAASDSTSVSLTGVQESECSPVGKEKYDINENGVYEIYKCRSSQQGFEYDRSCSEGEKVEYYSDDGVRNARCVDKDTEPDPEVCGNGIDDDGDGKVDEDCGILSKLLDFLGYDAGDGLLGQLHLGLSLIAGILSGIVAYKGSRWVDGEYLVRGSFDPFRKRRTSRIEKGRLVVGVLGLLLGFALGTWIALRIPLFVQLIVILGAGLVMWKTDL